MFTVFLIYGICVLINFIITGMAFAAADNAKRMDGVAAMFVLSFSGPVMTAMFLGTVIGNALK